MPYLLSRKRTAFVDIAVICACVFTPVPLYYKTCIRIHCLSRVSRTFKAKKITVIHQSSNIHLAGVIKPRRLNSGDRLHKAVR